MQQSNTNHDPIPLVVITGFLGSGKTTLLRRWRQEPFCQGAVVIVQDFSELGVDAELISGDDPTPEVGVLADRLVALHGVYAREKWHASMGRILGEISHLTPRAAMVLVESTGAAKPVALWQSVVQNCGYFVRHWIVTVDALNFHRDFSDGAIFLGDRSVEDDPALRAAASLLGEQLFFASVIILTKTDTVTKSIVEKQIQNLQKIQPHAAIACSAQVGLKLSQIDSIPAPKASRMEKLATTLAQQGGNGENTADVVSEVFRSNRPFHPQRLFDACQNELGTGLYRTKGFLWMASRADDVLVWQQAGSQVTLEFLALWRAGIVARQDVPLLGEEREILLASLEKCDADFGDRKNELTLIGQELAVKKFLTSLEQALCSDTEVVAWKKGVAFSDPWPTNLRKQ